MKQRKQGTAGFTLVELIVVIAILGILAGVGTVAYTGYVKRANKAVDQQLVADIAYALELSAAAGDFGSVEPPARLGETDLGLIPIGYVKLSKDADCQVYGIGTSEDGSYTATEDESGVIAQALRAAFGSGYENTLRLHYDWSGSTASSTGTANLSTATFIADVDQLWDKVQELSNTVYDKASDPTYSPLMRMLFGTTFTSDYDVISKSASPLAYLNLSAEGRSMISQWWCEPSMGLWLATNKPALVNIVTANGGEDVADQTVASLVGAVYARNTCMLNYVRAQMGVCNDTDCLNYKDNHGDRMTVLGSNFGALTGTSLNDALMGGCDIEDMFCKDCVKYAKVYCSEYAANDGLCFLEVMGVVQQADAANTSGAELGFDYYDSYIQAVNAVYGAMAEAEGNTGSAVVAVYYSNGKLSIDCNPVELGSFRSGETPTSSVATPASNTVNIIITEDESGNYTYTPTGVMTLDWSGQVVGYVKFYYQSSDGTQTEVSAADYDISYSLATIPEGTNATYNIGTVITITATTKNGAQGTGTISYTFKAKADTTSSKTTAFGISVQIKDSSKYAETAATNYFVGCQMTNASNNIWYQMAAAQVGYAATQFTTNLAVFPGSTVTLGYISVSNGAATQIRAWSMSDYTSGTIELSNIRVTASGSESISFNEATGVLTVSPSAQKGDTYTLTITYDYKSEGNRGTTTASPTKTLTVTVG